MWMAVGIVGSDVAWESLQEFGAGLTDMRPPLTAVSERLHLRIEKQFATEGRSGGRPWRKLSETYGRWKEARVPGLPKLVGIRPTSRAAAGRRRVKPNYVESGKMRKQLLAPDVFKVSRTRMVYAPLSDIAGFHQEGTAHMPERPPVVIPLRELAAWDNEFGAWLDTLMERAAV